MTLVEKSNYFKSLLGKRVLVNLTGNNIPIGTKIWEVSPNGIFVNLFSDIDIEERVGWRNIHDVYILDVLEDL